MGQPTWRLVAEKKSVPASQGHLWTPVLDYVVPTHLYRIVVSMTGAAASKPPEEQTWQPESAKPCTADGSVEIVRSAVGVSQPAVPSTATPPLSGVPIGALVARVGGGTAESGDTNRSVVFAVGRHCVFSGPDIVKSGSLFLGVNDVPDCAKKLNGQLLVDVYEAL